MIVLMLLASSRATETRPRNSGKTFASAESAAQALAAAARRADRAALREVLGTGSEQLQMSDKAQANAELTQFGEAFEVSHRIVGQSPTRATLEVGTNNWPFPIPLVQRNGQWSYDTEAGKDEVINRRIGRNELSALETVRAYVDMQREYAARDRDGDGILEYAQNILSAHGKKDGLYWSPELDGEMSPLGPLVAVAQGDGYMTSNLQKSGPRPFHGYYFKILTRQGKHAPGGKYNYVINGNMIGGFGLVAWPADYGRSGVMTFIINQQGIVYQKDLGPRTGTIAKKMDTYDPDHRWQTSPD
jgi:hypothetical protein